MNNIERTTIARKVFKDKKLSYKDITTGDILTLIIMLNQALKRYNKNDGIDLRLSEKINIKQNRNGTIKSCFIYVNSNYFTQREAISFNVDGFIGFCGWACGYTTQPFTNAFIMWVDTLKG